MPTKTELELNRIWPVLARLKATVSESDFLETNITSLMFLVRAVNGNVSSILEQATGSIFGFNGEELSKLESTLFFTLAEMRSTPKDQDLIQRIRIKSALIKSNWVAKPFHLENRAVIEKAVEHAGGSVEMVLQMAEELEADGTLNPGSTEVLCEAYAELEKHERVKREATDYVVEKVRAMVLAMGRPLETMLADPADRKEVIVAALKQLLEEFSK